MQQRGWGIPWEQGLCNKGTLPRWGQGTPVLPQQWGSRVLHAQGRSSGAILLSVFKSPCMKFPKEINCLQAPGPSVPRDPWDEFTELSINTAHEAQPCCWPGRSSCSHIPVFWECHCPASPSWPGKPRAVCRGPEQCSMLENPNPELRRDPEIPKPWTSWG